MSDRDELIAKARELSAAATPGPWRCIGDHGHFYVLAKAGDREKLIAETDARDRDTAMGDAVMTAAARTLLPALADLAESEGRRADNAQEIIEAVREFQDASRRHMSQRKHVASGLAVASAKLKALVLPPKEQP